MDNEFNEPNFEIKDTIPFKKPKKEPASKGTKVFVLILVAIFVLTASCVGAFYFGKNSTRLKNISSLDLVSKPEGESESSVNEVYENIKKSVVSITVYNNAGAGVMASGIVYSEDGYIITNDHIYSGIESPQFFVTDYEGKEYHAVYVGGDTQTDIAVIKVDALGMYPATFGNSDEITVGETVVNIGNLGSADLESVSKCNISTKSIRLQLNSSNNVKTIVTDKTVDAKCTGGPLVNMFSQVIGIAVVPDESNGSYGYAIPTTNLQRVIEPIIKFGYVDNRAKLGITYKELNGVLAEINGFKQNGLVVASVSEESDLFGKITEGDLIIEVNGEKITTDDVILEVIENAAVGDTVELKVIDSSGSEKTVSAKLVESKGTSSYTE